MMKHCHFQRNPFFGLFPSKLGANQQWLDRKAKSTQDRHHKDCTPPIPVFQLGKFPVVDSIPQVG